jgi:hypothetical protein
MNALDELYQNADSSPARNRLSALYVSPIWLGDPLHPLTNLTLRLLRNLSGNALTEFPSRLLTFKQLKSLCVLLYCMSWLLTHLAPFHSTSPDGIGLL